MRCLTLADALVATGAKCVFICREHAGNLIEHIRSKGHGVYSLPMDYGADTDLPHSVWLGATQEQDTQVCSPLLVKLQPDWLVVDHYALDYRWERAFTAHCGKIMVIDDLADRAHSCDLLLDQTYGRHASEYSTLVPEDCTLMCGSSYAMLRPEFAALRPFSLQRRERPRLKHLLITMGGIDKDNVTSQVLSALRACLLPDDCEITVVMGATAPWLADVQRQAETMPWPTTVRIGVSNMAQLMADSDLAIGAAGATSWERCCLGLPTIMFALAENQTTVADGLSSAGAARVIELSDAAMLQLTISIAELSDSATDLTRISQAACNVVDGKGLEAVVGRLRAANA